MGNVIRIEQLNGSIITIDRNDDGETITVGLSDGNSLLLEKDALPAIMDIFKLILKSKEATI